MYLLIIFNILKFLIIYYIYINEVRNMSGKNKRKINNKIKAKEIVNTNNGNGNIIVANNYKQITYNIVNNIIKDSQSESKDEFRNLLWSLYKNTHTRKHQFYGFVNGINYKKKKFYIVNLYWRKFVYATNHVVAFYDNNCPVQIGDNIVFNGELYMYEREDGTEDIGINNMDIITNTHIDELPNLSIIDKDITIDSCFLNNLDSIELRQIFNNQYSYIGITLENKPQINPDMYKSILFNIFYESSKENDLIINKLDILDGNTDLSELTKLSIFIKYLVVDKNVSHPYHIYNILLLLKSEIYGINTTNFNRYKRIAINNRVVSPIYVMNIFKEFLLYYNVYIEKLKVIFKEVGKDPVVMEIDDTPIIINEEDKINSLADTVKIEEEKKDEIVNPNDIHMKEVSIEDLSFSHQHCNNIDTNSNMKKDFTFKAVDNKDNNTKTNEKISMINTLLAQMSQLSSKQLLLLDTMEQIQNESTSEIKKLNAKIKGLESTLSSLTNQLASIRNSNVKQTETYPTNQTTEPSTEDNKINEAFKIALNSKQKRS